MGLKTKDKSRNQAAFKIDQQGDLPAVTSDAYQILIQETFPSKRLRLHIQNKRKSIPPDLTAFIEEAWDRAVQKTENVGVHLFNGRLFSFRQHQVRQGTLNLLLGETDYKELLGTNLSLPERPEIQEEHLSDGIAVCTAIITSDGSLILGRRSHKVHGGRGKIHVCAGHPDPDRLLSPEEILMGENLFFSAMKSEMREEFKITADQISGMVFLGLIRSSKTRKPEAVFRTSLEISSREVLKRYASAKDRDEHEEVFSIPFEQKPLLKFLQENYSGFTAPGLAAVIFAGMEQGFWTHA